MLLNIPKWEEIKIKIIALDNATIHNHSSIIRNT